MDTTTEPTQTDDDGPRATREEMRDVGRLRRTIGPDRTVAGVAGGLARHLDIDPLIVRVALVVLIFFGGAGLIIYGAGWLLIPQDGAARPPFGFDDCNRTIALAIALGVAALAVIGDSFAGVGFPWPVVLLALIALVVLAVVDRDRVRPTAPPEPVPGWTPPPAPVAVDPRRRGPRLFWWTMALAALGVGLLGIIDTAGVSIADGAYPALVLGIIGLMLVVGAFFGRAGGLIAVGIVTALVLVITTAAGGIDATQRRTPATASAVSPLYEIGLGELEIDLTSLSDPEALDGRVVQVRAGVGSIEVLVPQDLDVDVNAQAGLGEVAVFGETQDGGGIDLIARHDGGPDAPRVTLDINVGVGEVLVVAVADSEENR